MANNNQTAIAVPKDSVGLSLDKILETISRKNLPVEDLDELLIAAIDASKEEDGKDSVPNEDLEILLQNSPPEVIGPNLDDLL